jgi:hypothetical protein
MRHALKQVGSTDQPAPGSWSDGLKVAVAALSLALGGCGATEKPKGAGTEAPPTPAVALKDTSATWTARTDARVAACLDLVTNSQHFGQRDKDLVETLRNRQIIGPPPNTLDLFSNDLATAAADLQTRGNVWVSPKFANTAHPLKVVLTLLHEVDHLSGAPAGLKGSAYRTTADLKGWFAEEIRVHTNDKDRVEMALEVAGEDARAVVSVERFRQETDFSLVYYQLRMQHLDALEIALANLNRLVRTKSSVTADQYSAYQILVPLGNEMINQKDPDVWATFATDGTLEGFVDRVLTVLPTVSAEEQVKLATCAKALDQHAGDLARLHREILAAQKR